MRTARLLRAGAYLLVALSGPILTLGGERGPFDALREGRVSVYRGAHATSGMSEASRDGEPFGVLVSGRDPGEVYADGTFRIEGLPTSFPVRAHLIARAFPWGGGLGLPSVATPPVVLDAESGFASTADVHHPGAPPPVVYSLDLVGPGGSRTLTFPLAGGTSLLQVTGWSATGQPLDPAVLVESPSLKLESTEETVAAVSSSGEVLSVGNGLAWIRVSGDGEWAQVLVHVDPELDTDSDGLPDSYEEALGLDPSDPADGELDPDGDGLSSREEFLLGTHPLVEDTDGDLLADGAEFLQHGTDPLLPDTDGDFSLDGSEVSAGKDPLNPNDKPGPTFTPALERTRSLSSTAVRAAISDNDYAFIVSEGGRITSYRIDPSNYFLIFNDTEVLPAELLDISVLGSTAYLAAGDDGILMMDVSNPAVLSLQGAKTGLGPVYGLVAREGKVYVAGGLGLWILEPQPDGTLDVLGALGVPAFSRLALSGPLAFLGIPGGNRLISVDVSDATAPRELERFAMPSGTLPFRALEAAGSFVYVAHGGAGLVAIDARDPERMELLDTSGDDFPGASFDAVARIGNLLLSHTDSDDAMAQIYRLADDGSLDPVGSVETEPAGTFQLVARQNYLLSLSSGSFTVSEILERGDRGSTGPVGTLLLDTSGFTVTPGALVGIHARVRDDVFVESVEFHVGGWLVARDPISPFRHDHLLDPAEPAPYQVTIEATAYDLGGNASALGRLILSVEADFDDDGVPDSVDPDVDGDGVSDLEERFPGQDGYVTDPGLVDTDGDGIDDGEEATAGVDGYITDGASLDTDGDGLTDAFEIDAVGTHPAQPDTDGDGIPDGDEDGDNDGLANLQEADLGTDPARADTDGDGVPDGAELALGLDPLGEDTDGDGIPDGQEDPDEDGLPNAEEILLGLNPAEPDTDSDAFDDLTEVDLGTDPATPTDFSSLAIMFASKTVVLRGPVTVASLTLENAVLTVPPASGADTPILDLTVAGALSVDSTSRIDVSGKGYPGGRGEGNPDHLGVGPPGLPRGGELTGGSHGGLGGHPDSLQRADVPPVHGNVKAPGFAGGGGSSAISGEGRGGNGGGVLWLRAGTIELEGEILADGEGAPAITAGAAGAGGSIRIECVEIGGSGSIHADGGSAPLTASPQPGGGGGGRVSVKAQDAIGLDRGRITARGGGLLAGEDTEFTTGGAGTVFLRQEGEPLGELIVENEGRAQDVAATLLPGAGEGTVAEVGDDFLVRLEGDFPPGVEGLEIDPNADDGELQAFEILAVDGNRITTRPGLLDHTEPGARYRGVFRFDGLTVRDGGALETDAIIVAGTEAGELAMAGGSELYAPTLRVPAQTDIRLEDAGLVVDELVLPPEGSARLTVVRTEVHTGSALRLGELLLEESLLVTGGALEAATATLQAATITVPDPTTAETHALELSVSGLLSIDAASALELDGKGYLGAGRGDNAERTGQTADHAQPVVGGRTGGSHGGLGGVQGTGLGLGVTVAPVFDDYRSPRRPGGGGSGKFNEGDLGYNGGGLVRIVAGDLLLDGRISADGDGVQRPGNLEIGGAGAGGGIFLDVDVLRGSGEVSADGGAADGATGSGCGGGGRIAVHFGSRDSFTGSVHAFGGVLLPETDKASSVGGAGTTFWQSREQLYGDLVVDNEGRDQSSASTPLRSVGTGTIQLLAPNTLQGDTVFETSDTGLEGLWVVVNEHVLTPFRIESNSDVQLDTDPASGDMTAAGAAGDSFQGAHVLDNLTVTRSAKVSSGGDLIILTGEVTVSEGGVLTAPPPVFRD